MFKKIKYHTLISAFSLLISLSVNHAFAKNGSEDIITLTVNPVTETLFKASAYALQQSRDGGLNWAEVPLPPSFTPESSISSVVVSSDGQRLYLADITQGIFVTRGNQADWGKSWEPLTKGLPSGKVIELAAHSTLPESIYAVIGEKSIYRSEDTGENWVFMDDGPDKIDRLIHTNMEGSMQTGWLFAATPQAVQRSMDCFCLWREAGELKDGVTSLGFDPKTPAHVYAIRQGKLFLSKNGGELWQQQTSPAPNLSALSFVPNGVTYAITTDGNLFSSKDKAVTWIAVDE